MESSLSSAVCSSRWGYGKYVSKATLNPKPNAFGPCVANVTEICNILPEHAGVQAEVSVMETWVSIVAVRIAITIFKITTI